MYLVSHHIPFNLDTKTHKTISILLFLSQFVDHDFSLVHENGDEMIIDTSGE